MSNNNLPPGVLPSDPHISGYEDAPDREVYCHVCHYEGPMEGSYVVAQVAIYICPECESEVEVEDDDPFGD